MFTNGQNWPLVVVNVKAFVLSNLCHINNFNIYWPIKSTVVILTKCKYFMLKTFCSLLCHIIFFWCINACVCAFFGLFDLLFRCTLSPMRMWLSQVCVCLCVRLVRSSAEVMQLINSVLKLRSHSPTLVHMDSSRSHFIVTLTVTSRSPDALALGMIYSKVFIQVPNSGFEAEMFPQAIRRYLQHTRLWLLSETERII